MIDSRSSRPDPAARLCTVGHDHPGPTAAPARRARVSIGSGLPLAIIAGPCVLESRQLGLDIGGPLRDHCRALGLPYIFKASFDKANRSSIHSARGPGLDQGLAWLGEIGDELGVPVTTDIHEPAHAAPAAAAVDLLQIPAFLCRQTDLLLAAGEAAAQAERTPGRHVGVSIKKGQFLAPKEMLGAVKKLHEVGCDNLVLIERGTFFGYHRLVTDFIGVGDLIELDCSLLAHPRSPNADRAPQQSPDRSAPAGLNSPPVCFDCTHSCQLPGAGEQTGGRRDRSLLQARAAVAAGVHALFLEVHPDPPKAMSDSSTQLWPDMATTLLREAAAIRNALHALHAAPHARA